MKAIVYYDYGPPDVLKCEDIEKPVPRDHEVLIRVRAAGVNPLDCAGPRGATRILNGWRRPRFKQLGVDVAGEVESVGRNVTEFKPGDPIFGLCLRYPESPGVKVWLCQGAFAEYASVPESMSVRKPENVMFEQAASMPVAALTALQGLRDKGQIQPGQRVLINGAAGGVGTFAVQIAKAFGAEVTGVCSARNAEMVHSIGADHVVAYTTEDFTRGSRRYDLILDCVGNHSLPDLRRVLNPKGKLVLVGDKSGRGIFGMLTRVAAAFVSSWFTNQKMATFLARPCKQDLLAVRDFMGLGKITPVVDRCYSLHEAVQALRYVEEGHARGKVIISVS